MEPQKPFACTILDCGMAFTNEDHLHVHIKKHDMALQLGAEQKSAFVADQTPTPTRFIRNCEEVGLFQELQVNPFDEGFKRAMDSKMSTSILSLDGAGSSSEDVLHTPQMVFPNLSEVSDATLFNTRNNKNIVISRSSSDENGSITEYETTTISKLRNEVTTISRVVGKHDILDKKTTKDDISIIRHEETNKDVRNETVSYTNNVIKIHSNVEIKKQAIDNMLDKDTVNHNKNPQIISQKSIDLVVDNLISEVQNVEKDQTNVDRNRKRNNDEDIEVIIKLPNRKAITMKAIKESEDNEKVNKTKEKLKAVLNKKVEKEKTTIPNLMPFSGTLLPVTYVAPILLTNALQKVPIPVENVPRIVKVEGGSNKEYTINYNNRVVKKKGIKNDNLNNNKINLESRSAASKRYRDRLRQTMSLQKEENELLREINHRLKSENTALKTMILEHIKKCSNIDDFRNFQENTQNFSGHQ